MDVGQDLSGNDNQVLTEKVMNGLGEPQVTDGDTTDSHEATADQTTSSDTLSVQKRLKAQKRAHDRELREMQTRMDQMQAQLESGNQNQSQQYGVGNNSPDGNNDAIRQAVTYALQHKEMEERRVKEAEAQQHIAKQYAELNRHLDQTADKYDDFEDIVRGDTPFTAHMRDAALMLPRKGPGSSGEVLYQLGKNPDEVSRIAKLHPVEQAKELVALSHALIQGSDSRQSQSSRPLGQIKSNPVVNANHVTEKTPVSDIRSRMKKGVFK